MNGALYLKKGVFDTLSNTYGYDIARLVNSRLIDGDYIYITDGYEDQDNTYIQVEMDSWTLLPYLGFFQFLFDKDDFEYNE